MNMRTRRNRHNKTSRRNRKHRGGGRMSCTNANDVLASGNAPAFKIAMATAKLRECKKVKVGNETIVTGEENTSKTVAPNKRWYNYRAREGEQGKWTGKNSIFKNGNTLPVKSCASTTLNNHGRKICANNTTAKNYNYVQ